MASFHLLFLVVSVVSAYGYELNTRQQYLPSQTYPSQNGYAVVYTANPQVPVRTYTLPTYPTYSYPANYVIPRQAYYIPYSYQPRDTTPQVTYSMGYPVQRQSAVPSVYEAQMYSPSYPYQASQQRTYPTTYTVQQDISSPMQENQGVMYSSGYPYQTKESSPKVLFPFRGYAAQQENVRTRPDQEYLYQTKEALPKPTLPVRGYLVEQDTPMRQEQTYPYQTKETYPERSANTRPYPDVYAPRYPEGYYQTENQGYPTKQEVVPKNLRPNKPVIHMKYDSARVYPSQHIKEEVMQQNRKDSWVNDEDYEKNAIKVDRNLVY